MGGSKFLEAAMHLTDSAEIARQFQYRDENIATLLRKRMMDSCRLHHVMRIRMW